VPKASLWEKSGSPKVQKSVPLGSAGMVSKNNEEGTRNKEQRRRIGCIDYLLVN